MAKLSEYNVHDKFLILFPLAHYISAGVLTHIIGRRSQVDRSQAMVTSE